MCTGFEPLLMGAGEAGIAEMVGLGAGDLIGSGAIAGELGAGAALGLGATDMSLGAAGEYGLGQSASALGGLGATDMSLGTAGAGNYLASLGGEGTLAGSEFMSNLAPFTQSATDVASITGNAVPGLENNISTFEGLPESGGMTPPAQESLPGLSQGSNLASRGISLQAPEAGLAGQNYINGNVFSGQGLPTLASNVPANGGLGMQGTMGAGTSLGYGSEGLGLGAPSEGMFAGAGPTAASTSPFSLQNMMNNPMGMVKSAYDTVSKNPIPSMYAAGSLYDMYAKNKMAEAQKGMYNQNRADIMNTYTPGSPEYNLLQQQIARKDAAAGRNSQYGTRANELAGTIAKLRMGALGTLQQGQNTLGNQALSNQYGMFNTPLALAMYSQKPNAAATASY
jgi:hypothetical protein